MDIPDNNNAVKTLPSMLFYLIRLTFWRIPATS